MLGRGGGMRGSLNIECVNVACKASLADLSEYILFEVLLFFN